MEETVNIAMSATDVKVIQKALRFFAANLDDYNDWLADIESADEPVQEQEVSKAISVMGA